MITGSFNICRVASILLASILFGAWPALAEQLSPAADKNIFVINQPDYKLSPHTGMTRTHWKDAATYLLDGAFSHIHSLDDPMVFPRFPGEVRPADKPVTVTEKLEGLSRTLFAASVLLRENPELTINNIKVADYYRHQLVKLTKPDSNTFIPHRKKDAGTHQTLVEFGAISISLFVAPEILWHPLSKSERDALASVMLSWGDGPTVPSNWKFFNIFILSFFKQQGYAVNESLLEEYLNLSLGHYRGEGWYNDNPAYDYYSMWAFQMYGILWADFFGKQYYPQIANRFIANFHDINDNYPYLFARNGDMIMWGRSISYRFASITPLTLMSLEGDDSINFGWMRRIASGNLLQFLQHPQFLQDRIPTLGFYGSFAPAVQQYSVRGSSYWSLKAFMALLIPADNPFWTAKENEGAWENRLVKNTVHNKFQPGSKILITNYPNIGASEVRAWCNVRVINNWEAFRGSENYNRLAYNSAFPWQADGANGEVAMNYLVKNKQGKWEALRLFDFKKFDKGIYYRTAVLETDDQVRFNLADIPLANGILRIDQNLSKTATDFRLGHYALPDLGQGIRKSSRKVNNHEVHIIDNGEYQLAMVALQGWDKTETLDTRGLHPASEKSAVINVAHQVHEQSTRPVTYATLMLWKKSGSPWTNKELTPIKSIKDEATHIDVTFNDKTNRRVSFE